MYYIIYYSDATLQRPIEPHNIPQIPAHHTILQNHSTTRIVRSDTVEPPNLGRQNPSPSYPHRRKRRRTMPRYGGLCSIQIQPTQIYVNASREKKAKGTRPFINVTDQVRSLGQVDNDQSRPVDVSKSNINAESISKLPKFIQ